MDARPPPSEPAPSAPLPDARADNWVDRWAPVGLRPWLKLARLDRPIGIWLLMLPGWQGIALADAMAGRWPQPRLLAIVFVGAVLMRAAGCAFNDIVDRDLDAQVARTAARPVASGQIGRAAAAVFCVICLLSSAALLLTLNRPALWLALASLPLVLAYPFMKRITWWPQAWLGLTFNWGALLGYAAAGGAELAPALLLYGAGVCWTLGYDTIYALQDIEDDALAGVRSSARRLGRAAPQFVNGAYIVALFLALAAGYAGKLSNLFTILVFAQAAQFGWQGRRLRPSDPASALAVFKSNALAGLILTVALAMGRIAV
ncbi:MAG TPA: 4-hydroxybenzoate octaprenyltransferase [Caulobacteraceae bacterium]|jgi:4-hydroxybenzoate polyprenyltransferase|nr:4-hydroxybenzoate octaprenyltransferase [Caulobacteraceae bacterium]